MYFDKDAFRFVASSDRDTLTGALVLLIIALVSGGVTLISILKSLLSA
jgi:hypothetical protein